MREIENLFARTATSVVHDRLCQHANQSRLTGIDVPDHCYSRVILRSHSVRSLELAKLFLDVFSTENIMNFFDNFDKLAVGCVGFLESGLLFALFVVILILRCLRKAVVSFGLLGQL